MNNFHRIQNLNWNFGKFLICSRKFDWKSDTRHYFLEFGAKSGKKFIKNSQKKCKIRSVCDWISECSLIHSQKKMAIFDEKNEIRERCKGVHCVDLGESFPTSMYWQKSASIQPRTSPSKFGGKYSILFTGVLSYHRTMYQCQRGRSPNLDSRPLFFC